MSRTPTNRNEESESVEIINLQFQINSLFKELKDTTNQLSNITELLVGIKEDYNNHNLRNCKEFLKIQFDITILKEKQILLETNLTNLVSQINEEKKLFYNDYKKNGPKPGTINWSIVKFLIIGVFMFIVGNGLSVASVILLMLRFGFIGF